MPPIPEDPRWSRPWAPPVHLSSRTRAWATLAGAVVLVLLVVVVSQLGGLWGSSPAVSTPPARATVAASPSSVPWVDESALDAEARRTVTLVRAGGPFPYPRNDGVTYHNANRRLPPQRDGYYREYTVPTPGSSSRGARRVITGQGGDLYYTSDHYDSFQRVRLGT